MENELTKITERDVKPAMDLIYGLREIGVEQEIDIPQVAVIGDQSSGKSSVLEAICSLPLPRGAGLTTRCAIELRLSNTESNTSTGWKANIATSKKSKQISVHTIEELERGIADKANELVDVRKNGGFSKERIIVEIASKSLPNLTLIDLPGIIRTETQGQSSGAIKEVRDLIQGYVQQERTILLVVASCTQDIATVEALEWAFKADPSGKRTIGVLTKPDLIDKGAESVVGRVLANEEKPLSLGYVMLKNRSQEQVNQNLSVAEARENEREYFNSHPIWSSMNSSLFGVENLIEKISKVLVSRIHASIPYMRTEVNKKLEKVISEISEVGEGPGETPQEASMKLMTIIFNYNTLLTDATAGRYANKKLWNPNLRLCTRVRDLYESFRKEVLETRPKFEDDKDFKDSISNEIKASRGKELPGFLNPRIFESRIARYIENWKTASEMLVSNVRALVGEVTHDLFSEVSVGYPGLKSRMHDLISSEVQKLEQKTREEVESMLEREIGQPITLNEQFLDSVNAKRMQRFDRGMMRVLEIAANERDIRGNPKEKVVAKLIRGWYEAMHCSRSSEQRIMAEAEDMSTMLGCYWDVAADRFVDNHVIVVENRFVKPLASAIQVPMNEIVMNVSKSGHSLDALLQEDPKIVRRRRELLASKSRLENARKLINKF